MRVSSKLAVSTGALVVATVLGIAPSADACIRPLVGTLTTHAVPCDTLCTEGPLEGGFTGKLEFVMDTMEETGIPNVVRYTGVNTIITSEGTISGHDVGLWNLATGEFIDYTDFESGTGKYEGMGGRFTIAGKYDPITSEGSSQYVAMLTAH